MKCRIQKSSGFVGIVFLAIALIAIVIASIASMSRDTPGNIADQKIKTDVAVILKHGADFKTAMDLMLINGAPITTFNNSLPEDGPILFNNYPEVTKQVSFRPPPNIADIDFPNYDYQPMTPGGPTEGTDSIFLLKLASKKICQIINNMVNNAPLTEEPHVWSNGYADSYFEGCADTGDGSFYYYKKIHEDMY